MMQALKKIYAIKFYVDITKSQLGWFTSILPEIMAIIYITEKIGLQIDNKKIIIGATILFAAFVTFGYTWKKLGLYDVEQLVNASKNPVQADLHAAAKKILNKEC